MQTPLTKFLRRARSETGAATIPAVLMLPIFLIIMFSGVEFGMLVLRKTMFERGVDMASRDLRLGIKPMPDHEAVKRSICDKTILFSDCMRDLAVEVFEVDRTTWSSAGFDKAPTCTDRSDADPLEVVIQRGQSNQLMLMRACIKARPLLPGMGLGAALLTDSSGQFPMVATTAFVNEPRLGSN